MDRIQVRIDLLLLQYSAVVRQVDDKSACSHLKKNLVPSSSGYYNSKMADT